MGFRIPESKFEKAAGEMDKITNALGVFNDLFAERGWIYHDWINTPAAQAAVAAARIGDFATAESLLAEAISSVAIDLHLNYMRKLRCFRNREPLARLAAQDYAEERYHACVPVVLALLDGMGQELTGAGFLRQGARFVPDDSFVEIGPGMAKLIRTLTVSRGGTSTDAITIPYRHGILHGVDLGYASRLVAAKAWGALFAAGCYAKSYEDAQAPKPEQKTLLESYGDLLKAKVESREIEQLLANWQPRSPDQVRPLLSSPQDGSPEYAATVLLDAWCKEKPNYLTIALSTIDGQKAPNVHSLAGRIRDQLPERPHSYKLTDVVDEGPAISVVSVTLEWSAFATDEIQLRLHHCDNEGLTPSNNGRGKWLALNLWPLEAVRYQMEACRV